MFYMLKHYNICVMPVSPYIVSIILLVYIFPLSQFSFDVRQEKRLRGQIGGENYEEVNIKTVRDEEDLPSKVGIPV